MLALSHEVALVLLHLGLLLLFFTLGPTLCSLSLTVMVSWPPVVLLMVYLLGELHRAPLDFSEGESELVSGFNVEYGGSLFAWLFLGEHGMVPPLATVLSLLAHPGFLFFWVVVVLMARRAYPRYRYDLFMALLWYLLLPLVLWSLLLVKSLLV